MREIFIHITKKALEPDPNIIADYGPDAILALYLVDPSQWETPEIRGLGAWIEQNQEEVLQILAALGGLC